MSENESKSFLSSLKEAVLPRTENTEGSTPMALPDDAPVEISAEVQELLERGAHFGHKKSKLHPSMLPFITGVRNTVHIIDVQKTWEMMQRAAQFLQDQAALGKTVLFVGTKPSMRTIVQEHAVKCGVPYVVERWAGGTLTNWKTISLRIDHLRELEAKKASPDWEKYTKQERSLMDQEIARLTLQWGGIRDMKRLPDAVVIVDATHDETAMREAHVLKIPIVGLVNPDTKISDIAFPIPANDNSRKTAEYILQHLQESIVKGKSTVIEKPREHS